jgi:hypothetical protein
MPSFRCRGAAKAIAEKRHSSWPTAGVRSHGRGWLAAAAAQPPCEANPLWPCALRDARKGWRGGGREGRRIAGVEPSAARVAGRVLRLTPSRGRRARAIRMRGPAARTRRPSAAGTRTCAPTAPPSRVAPRSRAPASRPEAGAPLWPVRLSAVSRGESTAAARPRARLGEGGGESALHKHEPLTEGALARAIKRERRQRRP